MMTPCEKLGYKIGDRFEVLNDGTSSSSRIGDIVRLSNDDRSENPWFFNETRGKCDVVCSIKSIRPLNPQTEAEKRGAKFGAMGVIKLTGEKCIFIKENGYMWRVCTESGDACNYVPKNIRLDHEPEYKEIPFSEATEEQRMRVENLVLSGGEKVDGIEKSLCGKYYKLDSDTEWFTIYDHNGNAIIFSDFTDPSSCVLTVRVPA